MNTAVGENPQGNQGTVLAGPSSRPSLGPRLTNYEISAR